MANVSDNIQVAIRIRPLIKSEKEENLPIQWGVQNNNIYQIDESGQRNGELYSFDHIFQMCKSNTDIYEDIVKDFVDSSLNGLNSTIFAYGQTSSGKTYTMLGTENDRGLVPLAIDSILDCVSKTRDRKFLLRVSYVEIYNERINDLLDPSNTDVKIREFSSGAIGLQSVKEEIVSNRERVFELLKIGARNRHMGSTRANERSSRSHTIFKIVIESVEVSNFDDKDLPVQISSLNLVDLAGSERVAHTRATGMRLKEGGHINKSLSALGLVIRQLSDGQEFANFRDSKLTRLLQHSLGGNAKTLIICTITLTSVEFTNSTLSFAQRAKAVKNKPQINEIIPDSATCKHYALMNAQLKEKLEEQLKKNKDLERDKEKNFKEISRLQEQMHMLEMFVHGKEKDSAITIPKRRHTICHPVKTRPLRDITEESEDGVFCLDTQNLEECTPAKRKIFTLSSEFTTPDCSNTTVVSEINSVFSTPASVSRSRLQSLEGEATSIKDDGSVFNESLTKVEELDTQLDYESQTNSYLQKLEEQLIVVQLNSKFKKREEELLNEINALQKQLKEKEEKNEEKHDFDINTDMQYLQEQLIILHGILESSKSCDSPNKNSCDQIIECFNSKMKIAKDMIQCEIFKEINCFEELNKEPLVLSNELDSFKCLLNELMSFEKDLPSEFIYTKQVGDVENIKNLHTIYESLLKKNNLIRRLSETVGLLEEEVKMSKKEHEKQLSDVKEDHDREKNDLKATINKLDEERRSLVTALQIYDEHKNNDDQELKLLQERITIMNRDHKKQLRNLQDSHDKEKNDLKATIEKLREEKSSLVAAIEEYQSDRIRSDAKICELTSQNDEYSDKIKSLEDTLYGITAAVGEYENKPEDENDSVAYKASLQQIKSEIDDYKSRSDNETKALKTEIDRLNRLILEDKVKIDRLNTVVKECKAKSAEDAEALTSLKESNNNYVEKIKALEEKIESLDEQVNDLKIYESKTACLNCDIDRYKHQIKEYSAALEEFKDLNGKLKSEITRIQIKHETELGTNAKKSEEDLKKLQDEIDIINEKKLKSEMLNDMLHQTLRNIIEKFIEEEKILLSVKVLQEQKDSLKNIRKEMKDIYMNLKNQFHLFREKSGYDMEKINELLIESCDILKMFYYSEKQLHELDLSRKEHEISVLKEFNKNGCPNCNSMKSEIVDLKNQINSKEAQLTETLAKLRSSQEALLSTGRQSQENPQNVCFSCEELKKQNQNLKKALSDKVCELFEMRSKWSKEKEKRLEVHRSDILDMYRDIEIAQNKKIAELENIVKGNEKKIEEFKKIIEVDRKTVAVQCPIEEICIKCQEIKKEAEELRAKYELMKVTCAGRKQEIEDLKRKLK